jgi:hypothetical protein
MRIAGPTAVFRLAIFLFGIKAISMSLALAGASNHRSHNRINPRSVWYEPNFHELLGFAFAAGL